MEILLLSITIYFLLGFALIVYMRMYDPIKPSDEWNSEICAWIFWPLLAFYYIGFYFFHEDKGLLTRNVTRAVDFIQKDRSATPDKPTSSAPPKEQDQLKQCNLK